MKKLLLILLFLLLINKVDSGCQNFTLEIFKAELNRSDLRALNVIITTYEPKKEQCDSEPLITATGDKINIADKPRWIAVSRDLLFWHFNFNDTVEIICPVKKLCGKYIIKDVMNKRFTNRIDILIFDKKENNKCNGKILF